MHLDSSSKHSAPFLFFLDLLDIFRFRVWIPSFFMVSGLFTWGQPQSPQWVKFPSEDPSPLLWLGAEEGLGWGHHLQIPTVVLSHSIVMVSGKMLINV